MTLCHISGTFWGFVCATLYPPLGGVPPSHRSRGANRGGCVSRLAVSKYFLLCIFPARCKGHPRAPPRGLALQGSAPRPPAAFVRTTGAIAGRRCEGFVADEASTLLRWACRIAPPGRRPRQRVAVHLVGGPVSVVGHGGKLTPPCRTATPPRLRGRVAVAGRWGGSPVSLLGDSPPRLPPSPCWRSRLACPA